MGELFERRALIPWFVAFGALASGLLLSTALGLTFDRDLPWAAPLIPAWLALGGMLIRRYGHDRFGGFLEAFALTHGAGALALFLTFALSVVSRPFADATLASWDSMIGLDVRDAILSVREAPILSRLIVAIYQSIYWQPTLILVATFATGQALQGWRFVAAWALCTCGAYAGIFLFPAINSYAFFGFERGEFPHMVSSTPWHPGEVMLKIKGEGVRHLSNAVLDGYATIPSFHAAAAVLFTVAIWPYRLLRWPILALNTAMLFATVVVGAHYYVDIITGVVMATGAALIANRLVR